MTETKELFLKIQRKISELTLDEMNYDLDVKKTRQHQAQEIIYQSVTHVSTEQQDRIIAEFLGWGPIDGLIKNQAITEILVQGPQSIWYEQSGQLYQHPDIFFSDLSFKNFINRLSLSCGRELSYENPFVETKVDHFRLTMVSANITKSDVHISIRRHPENSWTFKKLKEAQWCSESAQYFLKDLLDKKSNFLIVGPTGSGKTSVINSFLQAMPQNERCLVIEDTDEIKLPNSASMKMLTRTETQNQLTEIDQTQLLKTALRLRPDRLVMGEIRGSEAKDFLMALATGHRGSFGTLHARDAAQALIRLEMLIQMGAPQWSLQAIRRLIQLSLHYIVVVDRQDDGQRKLSGVYKISSLEEFGFLLERIEF